MRRAAATLLVLTVLAAGLPFAGAGSTTADQQQRDVSRLIATPTPLGPLDAWSDVWSWRVDVPSSAVVVVEAFSGQTSAFELRFHRAGDTQTSVSTPAMHQSIQLTNGAWIVDLDPTLGANVNIHVRFDGHVGDANGARTPFTLTDLGSAGACFMPSQVCLP